MGEVWISSKNSERKCRQTKQMWDTGRLQRLPALKTPNTSRICTTGLPVFNTGICCLVSSMSN